MNLHPESPHPHFHIHWEDNQNLDWECFESESDALGRAMELARPGEEFKIEEVSTNCPLRKSHSASAS
ncbi:MAG TPA: hypothetical protein VFE02_04475 [Candidatus Acidoferrales bacterium]|jgi:hypothetical protein|nr:hypothetical protein [Candidatus Acidoferrales bacterium]